MSYTTNPYLPRVRMLAVRKVKYEGWSLRQTARYFGVEPSTILRWCHRDVSNGWRPIPTNSSRPEHHPKELSSSVINQILALRRERNQCAEILHHRLTQEGVIISLSSVKRVLKRNGLTRFSQWKKWHQYPIRPLPEKPGILVEIDSMLDGIPENRLCVYALIDVCSRWACAWPCERINTHRSLHFIDAAQQLALFPFQTIQSDHGSEFSKWFTKMVVARGMVHRHSRVRTPTDNAHIERFIQTLQKDCLGRIQRSLRAWQKEIPEFLSYYNTERPHMALEMKTPQQVLRSY